MYLSLITEVSRLDSSGYPKDDIGQTVHLLKQF